MSRIAKQFEGLRAQGRKALIPFVTAGDPDREITVPLMHALVEAGADVIELGVPFSDPMADGPVIQRASERALKVGVGLRHVLAMVTEFRETNDATPVVLMGYANPIERMGYDAFCQAAKTSGVDGVLVVDYPPEECAELTERLKQSGIDPIFLLSPTSSDERISRIAQMASGYIYYVSLKGVTGAGHIDLSEIAVRIPAIKSRCGIPVGVGFGIRDGETARKVSEIADAVVIGSRIVQEIESSPRQSAVDNVRDLVRGIRDAMDKKEPQ
ncbi:MAG TPA: tryptophan synthase subunit alpha [Burkholderiales bacterium]|nr:tryptophan synthase subunit alpha [Burkholderiales bacterium]